MYGANRQFRLKHSLTTIGAVWLAATIAGIFAGLFPWGHSAEVASLLLDAALLAAYARWTEAGRQSAKAYFLAGLLLPIVCIAALIFLPLPRPDSALFICSEMLFAGLNVGFQLRGSPDAPLLSYLPLMMLDIFLPIVAVVGGRAFVRYHRAD